MSNYSIITDFAAKDSLLPGNPAKAGKGTEITAELQAISTAIASKADSASPVLTTPQINDTSSDHQYVVAVNELAADRTVTLPLLTGNDEFVFKDHAATLTNKTVNLTSNTLSGTKAQFNTACSDGDFLFVGDVSASDVTSTNTVTLTNKTLAALTNNVEARSGPDSSAFNFRNRLINPRGEVYQRVVAATADDAYFADRWYILSQTGTVTPSVLSLPEDGYPVGVRITQSQVSAQRFGFAQIIESKNCLDLRGKNSVLAPRIRISNSQAVRYAILGWTGTADAVTSDVVLDWTSSTYTAGNFFLAANLSVIAVGSQTPSAATWTSLNALTAANGSTFTNLIVMVWTEGTAAQNVTLDFDYIQLEQGQTPTPFEFRPVGVELELCERYCKVFGVTVGNYDTVCGGFSTSTILVYVFYVPGVRMRGSASLAYSALADLYINDGIGTIPITSIGVTYNGKCGYWINVNAASGFVQGKFYQLCVLDGATKYLAITSEL